MEFDDILLDVGDYGRCQLLILCCFIFPACAFSGIHSFIQLFLSTAPKDYRCTTPRTGVSHFSTQQPNGIVEPSNTHFEDWTSSKCFMPPVNYSAQNSSVVPHNVTQFPIPCTNGWTYGPTEVETVITTWNLVCTREWYTTFALLCMTFGSVCGLMVFGCLSDYLGRKITMFACLAIQISFTMASAFAPNFAVWCACRFFVGLTIPSALRIPMIYAIELVRPEKRTRVGILCTGCYTLGTIILAGLAYIVPKWRELSLLCSMPELLLLGVWWIVPESPRWLLAKNKSVEIKEFLRFTAKINRKILGSNTLNKLDLILDHESKKDTPAATVLDLFRLPNIRKKTLLITFIWFSNISVYMGLSYYSPKLGGSSIYLSYLLSMIMELPAYCAVWFMTEKFGRRLPLSLSMVCGGILCVITVGLPENNPDAILAVYLLGKFCISASFFVICMYGGELYPTIIRGIGLGTSATVATLGVCLGPIIIHVGRDYVTLPLVIFGGFAIVGAFAPLFLPETWHRKLPETLAEGEEFGKATTFMSLFSLATEDSLAREKSKSDDATLNENVSALVDQSTEDETAFERKSYDLHSFPQPSTKKQASRMDSSTYLITSNNEPNFS